MIANVHKPVLDYQGEPVLDGDAVFTIGDALLSAANAGGKQDEDAKGKTTRYLLAQRVAAAMNGDGQLSLTASEVVLLRDGVARLYAPLMLGRVMEELDPESLK